MGDTLHVRLGLYTMDILKESIPSPRALFFQTLEAFCAPFPTSFPCFLYFRIRGKLRINLDKKKRKS